VIAVGLVVVIRLLWLPRSEIRSKSWPGSFSEETAPQGSDRNQVAVVAVVPPWGETKTPVGTASPRNHATDQPREREQPDADDSGDRLLEFSRACDGRGSA